MTILYKNLLDLADVTATNEDSNYPVSNLTYEFQRSRTNLAIFKPMTTYSNITIDFYNTQSIDCIGIANHTITEITIKFYSNTEGLISTITPTLKQLGITTFPKVENVNRVIIELQGSNLQVGNLYLGRSLNIANSKSKQPINIDVTGDSSLSEKGVISGSEGVLLESFVWSPVNIDLQGKTDVKDFMEYCQTVRPFFIEAFEDLEQFQGFHHLVSKKITFTPSTDKRSDVFDTQFTTQEVR